MQTAKTISAILIAGAVASASAAFDASKLPPASTKTGVTYATDIKPLLDASCIKCHGAEKPKAGLRLDSLEGVLKGSKEGKILVVSNSAKSLIVEAVSQLDPESAMPPKPRKGRPGKGGPGGQPGQGGGEGGQPKEGQGNGDHPQAGAPGAGAPGGGAGAGGKGGPQGPPPKPLTAEQVGLVRAWIDQGAK